MAFSYVGPWNEVTAGVEFYNTKTIFGRGKLLKLKRQVFQACQDNDDIEPARLEAMSYVLDYVDWAEEYRLG